MNKNIMVSYSQNYEDVILQRVLKNVSKGFYIDVGAAHPVHDSVTCHFYKSGWSGINIDPLEKYFDAYQTLRPRDISLNVAASDFEGEIILFASEIDGWSTTVLKVAKDHLNLVGVSNQKKKVTCLTLNQICEKHAKQREIHFLKIDVEGGEKEVLLGLDLSRFRPWILLIEATFPNTQVEVFADWEPLLIAKKYIFAYADGLNRFYLAEEHSNLQEFFKYPPNIFDNFLRYNAIEPSILEELETLREKIANFSNSKSYKICKFLRRLFS